jgi:hypothetical protein
MEIPPEGISWGGPEVTFDQLPEQIRKHYSGGFERPLWRVNLEETKAILRFDTKPGEAGFGRVDCWMKTKDGWVLVVSGMAC